MSPLFHLKISLMGTIEIVLCADLPIVPILTKTYSSRHRALIRCKMVVALALFMKKLIYMQLRSLIFFELFWRMKWLGC